MKKLFTLLLGVLMTAGTAFGAVAYTYVAHEEISPAIDLLRAQTSFAQCGLAGNTLRLSADICASTLGITPEYAVVSVLPGTGDLTLDGKSVLAGQAVAWGDFGRLRFDPQGDGAFSTAVTFLFPDTDWEEIPIKCNIYLQSKLNNAPELQESVLTTCAGLTCALVLPKSDADGDAVTCTLTRYPTGGNVKITEGRAVYTPSAGFSGTDSFSVVASDVYGNRSAETTLTVQVEKNNSGIVFADMAGNAAHYAAVMLASDQVITYRSEHGELLFEPQKTVSRAEYLVMLLAAAGRLPAEQTEEVPYEDLTALSEGVRRCVCAAWKEGILKGNGAFRPEDAITRAEAAVWMGRLLALKNGDPQAFFDMEAFSAEATALAAACVDVGIFDCTDGNFRPFEPINREFAAQTLFAVTKRIAP